MASSASPLISIIVPAYNVATYIGEALESVFAQDFTDFETIVINDGSTDTPELELALEPFRDRITYIQQQNRGISAARNVGLHAAQGELIALLDSDDKWLPGKLTEQLKFMRDGNYDMVYADALLFGEMHWPEGTTFMDRSPSNGPVTLHSLLDLQATPVVSTVIMRRDLVLQVGGFDETDRYIPEDYELWLRMAQAGARIAYQRKPLAKYRYRSDSMSASRVKLHSGAVRVLQRARREMKLNPQELAALTKTEQQLQSTITMENTKDMIVKGDVDAAATMLSQARESNKSWKIPVALFLLRTFPGVLRNYLRRTHQPQ